MSLAVHVIGIAGGSGTRFWPLSRQARPKQLLRLVGEHSLLRTTFERVAALAPEERWWMVVGAGHALACAAELPEIDTSRVLIEPAARNTAAAVGLAAIHVHRQDPAAVMCVLPADHHVRDAAAFREALAAAAALAAKGDIVTLGATPTFAETGYGYIERGAPLPGTPAFRVQRFVEKPDRATAERFLAQGGFDWNAGIFVLRADRYLDELARQLPAHHRALQSVAAAIETPGYAAALSAAYAEIDAISIDHGVMQGARDLAVIPLRAGWSDLGSLRALEELGEPDADDNVLVGRALALDSRGCVIHTHAGSVVAVVGVANLAVITTPDATLVVPKERVQEVKELVRRLAELGWSEVL